jgi:Xaa-Pro aminopeptidase
MSDIKQNLFLAQQKAIDLFATVEKQGLIVAGKSEKQLCEEILEIAKTDFGVESHWGKKIVRTGINTLVTYADDAPDLIIKEDDILFFDFHPNFNGWEADFGRTYVLGNDPLKHKIKEAVEEAWHEGNAWLSKQTKLTGAEFFAYATELAKRYGYEFGNTIAGHIIGKFPHQRPEDPNDLCFDIHPGNHTDIFQLDKEGNPRVWMFELHFVDRENKIGAFFEQLLN